MMVGMGNPGVLRLSAKGAGVSEAGRTAYSSWLAEHASRSQTNRQPRAYVMLRASCLRRERTVGLFLHSAFAFEFVGKMGDGMDLEWIRFVSVVPCAWRHLELRASRMHRACMFETMP